MEGECKTLQSKSLIYGVFWIKMSLPQRGNAEDWSMKKAACEMLRHEDLDRIQTERMPSVASKQDDTPYTAAIGFC